MKKRSQNQKEKEISHDEEMTKVPKEIIDEINRENSNIELLKNATPKKEEKSRNQLMK